MPSWVSMPNRSALLHSSTILPPLMRIMCIPGMAPDREGTKHSFALFRTAFPEAEFEFEEVVAGEE